MSFIVPFRTHAFLNFSSAAQGVAYPYGAGTELLSDRAVASGAMLTIEPWGVETIEEGAK